MALYKHLTICMGVLVISVKDFLCWICDLNARLVERLVHKPCWKSIPTQLFRAILFHISSEFKTIIIIKKQLRGLSLAPCNLAQISELENYLLSLAHWLLNLHETWKVFRKGLSRAIDLRQLQFAFSVLWILRVWLIIRLQTRCIYSSELVCTLKNNWSYNNPDI